MNDINIRVRNLVGNIFERDCSCDSGYIEKAVYRVSVALRMNFYWVDFRTPIYLVLDNTGGHGTKDCVNDYVLKLKNQFNVEYIYQIPRSPYTNALDLGVWVAL